MAAAGVSGVLIGVGVGPGDPELLTLKAQRQIRAADALVYPQANGAPSQALAIAIAADAVRPRAEHLPLDLPMLSADRGPAGAAYDAAAAAIAERLARGRRVVCLCEGDPLFYGSFMHLAERLGPRFAVEATPGVSSVCAAAAAVGRPLVERAQSFVTAPATLDDDALAAQLDGAHAAAILKLGRHLPRVRALLERLGRAGEAFYVAEASRPGEIALPLAAAPAHAPYFSMILIAPGIGDVERGDD